MEHVHLKIRRRDGADGLSYWEEFIVPHVEGMTVTAALMRIREDPVTADGLPTMPVVWEQNCLEEVCGSCSMVINGIARQACSTLVAGLSQPIVLEPMSAFPVIRDLRVDRSSLAESFSAIRAWAELDELADRGAERPLSLREREELYPFSVCILCGCCVEACPQVNDRSPFMGAYLIAHAYFLNRRDGVSEGHAARHDIMKGPGGVSGCDNALNCNAVCPKDIPLGNAIAHMQWQTVAHSVRILLRG